MNIILNGDLVVIDTPTLTYEQIVARAGMTGFPTVAYSTKPRGDLRRTGTMHLQSPPLEIEEGMAINAVHTG